ncbi:MAG TPA: adenylate/guanylate cyclase domain-containing protein, partial [Candidatus Limnocylindria bacterium]|nr:adenylate/guanylate cyclase domain-containing protein [Candidatus Limnocylindria bacterium]
MDVVGSTDLQAMVGAERLKRTLDRAFAELSDIMTSEGGTIEKYTGDGVFAIFGAPRAHGDDPLRALRAAEASLSWANRNRDGQLQVGIRIGVETGDAVVDVHRTDVEHQQ